MVQINFKGRQFVQNHHLAVKYHQLVPDEKKSFTKKISLHDNLIIHGDNLKALKALLPTYAGKVKCIYIDPPYNTGNEGWVYNDNVNSPMMQEWLGKVVDREDLTRHDKWLCMMWPRLRLLRELLADDGIIFISIDEAEFHRLTCMMDEIFGEDNFLACLSRRTKSGGGSAASHFAIDNDFVLVYSKDKQNLENLAVPHDEEYLKRYAESDEEGRYFWDTMERSYTKTKPYKIKAPDGTLLEGKWFRSEDRFKKDLANGEVKFIKKKDGKWSVQFKQRLSDGKKVRSLLHENEWKSSTAELDELGLKGAIDFPKPVALLKHLIQSATDKDSLILDSFAGSGTAAHAVLALNKEDGGNRKFILVEMEDYADKLTAERVRRVSNGVKVAKDENLKAGLGGTFSYFTLGEPVEMDNILSGESLPSYLELARYIFFTATGERLDESKIDEKKFYVGESSNYHVFLFYKPDVTFLKSTALTLERAEALHTPKEKQRLVFAPTKYLDQDLLGKHRIDFAQLPFEIYKLAK